MSANKVIASFLQKSPLYSKIEIDKTYFHPERFEKLTFQFFCPNEGNMQTFMLALEPEKAIFALGHMSSDRFTDMFDPYQKDESISFTQHFSGECQFCKNYKVDFLLNVFSDGPMPNLRLYNGLQFIESRNTGNKKATDESKDHKLYIRKIGQFPPFEINPEKDIISFLQEEDKEYYKKSLICLSQSFGIAAYAYLRRITENEILRIVETLSAIEDENGKKTGQLYETYKQNKQMNSLIEGIFQFLPISLKSLGINPLKALYAHLSGGIHSDSEEICLQKAFDLDAILRFTIKKINEEKNELKEIRNAFKNLGY
jgi:hypothetical protein